MPNENENLDSLNEETELDENIELDALKEKHKETLSKNRQLFERAKKAEGELKEFRVKKPEPEKKPEVNQPNEPNEKLLKKINLALLKASGYNETDEIAVWNNYSSETGKPIDELMENPTLMKIIKAEIEEIRTTKSNEAATKNIQSGSGGSGKDIKSDPHYWVNKNESPPNTPEYKEVREKIRKIMTEKESGEIL